MKFDFKEFSTFRFFITPVFMQIIFWIGVGVIAVFSIRMMTFGGSFVLMGFIYLIVGPIFWRVLCESLIILFRIHNNLEEINRKK